MQFAWASAAALGFVYVMTFGLACLTRTLPDRRRAWRALALAEAELDDPFRLDELERQIAHAFVDREGGEGTFEYLASKVLPRANPWSQEFEFVLTAREWILARRGEDAQEILHQDDSIGLMFRIDLIRFGLCESQLVASPQASSLGMQLPDEFFRMTPRGHAYLMRLQQRGLV